jgi:serine protease
MKLSDVFALSTIGTLVALMAVPSFVLAGLKPDKGDQDLSYKFYDQRIQLVEKPNQVAIVFKAESRTRSFGEPADHIKLQNVLRGEGDSRTLVKSDDLQVNVKPLGERYAVLTLPATRSLDYQQKLTERLGQSYVQKTLPIFQRQDAGSNSNETIILNDEMILSFEPGSSKAQIDEILKRYDAEIVRPLRFSQNRYIVRSRSMSGAGLLSIVDQLGKATGVQSASPNFIQSIAYQPAQQASPSSPPERDNALSPQQAIAALPKSANSPYPDSLLPYQWHLNSRFRQALNPRTDIRATEAWTASKRGKGAVVAVIDSAIQWDHPDLKGNLYEVPQNLPDLLPGERYGWDFSGWGKWRTCLNSNPQACAAGDPDTRLSSEEIALVKPSFQSAFGTTEAVLQQYSEVASRIRKRYPNLAEARVAEIIRDSIVGEIASEFHGTWVSGVIAAKPRTSGGVVGVAPEAKILPVRVFGLGGEISGDALIEAIGYAAARKVDVINLSLGSLMPTQAQADQIFAVLDANPNLVIVASSGNENLDGSGYPAAIPGVISVGSSNLQGNRSPYSNYGRRLDVIAPGGDISVRQSGGILTTGGTFFDSLWQGITPPKYAWGPAIDPLGQYVQVQGTSFSSPTVAGVVALMKGEDGQRRLNREQITKIIQTTASYQPLKVTQRDQNLYRLQKGIPTTTILSYGTPVSNPGIQKPGEVLPIEQYYFGAGLVNAAAAVEKVQKQVDGKTASR